jgi:hypothetical protein
MKTKCQYPIGTQNGKTLFCDQTGVQRLGFCFCETHTGMAERGCLDIEYTDGTTPREIIKDNTLASVWFPRLKAKFHSKEGIRQLAIEHANDPIDEVEDL